MLLFFLELLFNIYGDKERDGTVAEPFDAVSKYADKQIYPTASDPILSATFP
jgi:hypothetical protein